MKKSKNWITAFFISLGILGFTLLVFGLKFDGTMSDDLQITGMSGVGIFALWGVVNIVDGYLKQRELENM